MNEAGLPLGNVTFLNWAPRFITHIKGVVSSSGFVWDKFTTEPPTLYFVDAGFNYNIRAYSFHSTAGNIKGGQAIFEWPNQHENGSPRRLTVDRTGKLWVPLDAGRGVIQVEPGFNQILRFISIPARRVGACTFGGPALDILYVSTIGSIHDNHDGHPPQVEVGSIYAVKGLGVQGWPPKEYNLQMHKESRVLERVRVKKQRQGILGTSAEVGCDNDE
ncbi:regucalcin-like [Belonocnema kinseyi]|uniref:regucalcin-like n=1 Tax=Belonocnema kinseyi TaxID=2817044 RepID=UPI00143CDD41|nr:regucalcin-like [Belonocnema kinseyi]